MCNEDDTQLKHGFTEFRDFSEIHKIFYFKVIGKKFSFQLKYIYVSGKIFNLVYFVK